MDSLRGHLCSLVTRSEPAVAQAMGTGKEQAKAVGEWVDSSGQGQDRQAHTTELKVDAFAAARGQTLQVASKPTHLASHCISDPAFLFCVCFSHLCFRAPVRTLQKCPVPSQKRRRCLTNLMVRVNLIRTHKCAQPGLEPPPEG